MSYAGSVDKDYQIVHQFEGDDRYFMVEWDDGGKHAIGAVVDPSNKIDGTIITILATEEVVDNTANLSSFERNLKKAIKDIEATDNLQEREAADKMGVL